MTEELKQLLDYILALLESEMCIYPGSKVHEDLKKILAEYANPNL